MLLLESITQYNILCVPDTVGVYSLTTPSPKTDETPDGSNTMTNNLGAASRSSCTTASGSVPAWPTRPVSDVAESAIVGGV